MLANASPKKLFILFLTCVYFSTNIVFAFSQETMMWKERRAALATPVLPQTLTQTPKWSDFKKNKSLNLNSDLRSLVDAIPLNVGTIQDVYDSGQSQPAPVVLIQDIHLNGEAQTNIATILQELILQRKIDQVGIEGAFGPLDFSPFQNEPRNEKRESIAREFLGKNLIGAHTYVGLTSRATLPAFVGVDDAEHYEANVQAYVDSQEEKKKVQENLPHLKENLADEKIKTFSKELKDFDVLRTAHHTGEINLGAYIKQISALNSDVDFTLEQFLQAYEIESTLDFKRVEIERTKALEKLTSSLSPAELKDLFNQSFSYRLGKISFGAYYENLKNLCDTKGLNLKQTPHFDAYIQYVLLSDGIKPEKLLVSMENLEKKILISLIRNEKEKQLCDASQQIALTEKLLNFSLTPKEWETYKGLSTGHGVRGMESFERFYEEAEIRSEKMAKHLESTTPSVLISGGFHTPEISALLKDKKISYVVVSPKITKTDDTAGNAYLTVFAREKNTLEKLFSGEKIFINPSSRAMTPTSPTTHMPGSHPQLDSQVKQAKRTTRSLLDRWGIKPSSWKLPDLDLGWLFDFFSRMRVSVMTTPDGMMALPILRMEGKPSEKGKPLSAPVAAEEEKSKTHLPEPIYAAIKKKDLANLDWAFGELEKLEKKLEKEKQHAGALLEGFNRLSRYYWDTNEKEKSFICLEKASKIADKYLDDPQVQSEAGRLLYRLSARAISFLTNDNRPDLAIAEMQKAKSIFDRLEDKTVLGEGIYHFARISNKLSAHLMDTDANQARYWLDFCLVLWELPMEKHQREKEVPFLIITLSRMAEAWGQQSKKSEADAKKYALLCFNLLKEFRHVPEVSRSPQGILVRIYRFLPLELIKSSALNWFQIPLAAALVGLVRWLTENAAYPLCQ